MNEKIFWFWLSMVMDTRSEHMNTLLEHFETPRSIFYAGKNALMEAGVPEKLIEIMASCKDEQSIIKKYNAMEKQGIKMTCYGDNDFPDFSFMGKEQPRVLYYMGSLPPPAQNCIAIIGARKCTLYGKSMAKKLGREAAEAGYAVISGMACGIDSAGHEGALSVRGKTYGILGSGVDICYPPSGRKIYDCIKENGGIISEYIPGTMPERWRFPLRNRIISGLSSKIIVVEAKEKSGSLITAEYGLEQGKDIYAVPGRADDVLSSGCNSLIKCGAGMITDIKDLFEINNSFADICKKDGNLQKKAVSYVSRANNFHKEIINIGLEKELQVVYSNVDLSAQPLEKIAEKCNMDISRVVKSLNMLLLKGMIKEDIKNYYSKYDFN